MKDKTCLVSVSVSAHFHVRSNRIRCGETKVYGWSCVVVVFNSGPDALAYSQCAFTFLSRSLL